MRVGASGAAGGKAAARGLAEDCCLIAHTAAGELKESETLCYCANSAECDMSEHRPSDPEKHQPRVEVYWTTVTYKTVAIYISLGFAIVLLVLYLIAPDRFMGVVRRMGESMAGSPPPEDTALSTQARFVNLDGKVQIKKVNSVQWVNADYRMTLDKGDLIQTGSDGVARLTFPDGTTYTVKPDTLITVEENSMAENRRTAVAIGVTSGAVDLSTAAFEPGSRSEVLFENARASMQPNSRAAVRSDPENKQHEITVTQGQASLNRGGQLIEIGRYERISFPTGGPVQRSQVAAPPKLKSPAHFAPMTATDPKRYTVSFEWEPVPGATSYVLRISRSQMFTNLAAERRVTGTSADVSGLEAGDYFWSVTAIDAQKRASEPSDTRKFTLVAQAQAQTMLLEVISTQLYGNQVEVVGRTEPGAAIIINGQAVTNINADGSFRYFTPPLPRGNQKIAIVGTNRRGGTNTRVIDIFIPN